LDHNRPLRGWEPGRLNPVIASLLERQLIAGYTGIRTAPFVIVRIAGNENIRRFVKSR